MQGDVLAASQPVRAALARCRPHLLAAAGFSALINLLYIAPTLYMLQVYDRVVPTQGELTLLFLTLVLLAALVTLSLLDRVRARLLVRAALALDAALAPALLDVSLAKANSSDGRLALQEFDGLRATLTGPGMAALLDVPWAPIYLVVCFLVHPAIGGMALLGIVILPAIAWRNETTTRRDLDAAQQVARTTYVRQEAMLGNAEAVRALGMRRALVDRQMRQRGEMLTLQTHAGFASGTYLTASKFVRLTLQSLALGLGALLAIDNKISAGAIFASSFLIARALTPIEQMIGNWRGLAIARSSLARLNLLLATVHAEQAATRLPAPSGALTLERVGVADDVNRRMILADISLQIAAGEVVAIVGPSGAGKSTLARVLAGAIVPDRGLVRLDGFAMTDWDPERLAPHVGYLPQDPSLFTGTIKENIARFSGGEAIGATSIDEAALAAARMARVFELVQALPGGFDHILPPLGRGLSAGQAQRIALARAMFRNPPLLVLDEPNAHLDAEGDAALVAALDLYKKRGHTVLIVSHKLSVLPIVDKLLVLRAGRMEAFGSRDEVLARIAPPRPRAVSAAVASA